MSIKPVLFNTEMVKAIIDGRKTQTRRVLKRFVPDDAQFGYTAFTPEGNISGRGTFSDGYGEKFYKLPCSPGDALWVREAFSVWQTGQIPDLRRNYLYKAGFQGDPSKVKWRPSIHMPKEAAWLFLRVTDVQVRPLQLIDESDIYCEGIILPGCDNCELANTDNEYHEPMCGEMVCKIAFQKFGELWDSTLKPADRDKYGWEANPWVWKIEFERCEKPEGWPC